MNYKEAKPHTYSNYVSRIGRSSIDITCPFCGTETKAYIWSMAGKGKKCDGCEAIHYNHGQSYIWEKKK